MPRAHLLRPTAVLAVLAVVLLWLSTGPTSPAAAATASIPAGDTWFCDPSFQGGACDRTIAVGDTVVWDFTGAALTHTTTECGPSCDTPTAMPLWDSGLVSPASPNRMFQHTFSQAGTYLYHCMVHPTLMRGRIIVQIAGATPTPTPPGRAGDANKDGTVNSIDAALVLQRTAGLLPSINSNADVNSDGRIDSIDAALILQFVAGLIPRLPPAGAAPPPPIFYP